MRLWLALLAPAFAAAGSTVEVCCVGAADGQADDLRRRDIAVHVLGWTRWLDSAALWDLRQLLRSGRFDALHVWRLAALRAVALAAREMLPRAIVSAPLPRQGKLSLWDRRLLRSAARWPSWVMVPTPPRWPSWPNCRRQRHCRPPVSSLTTRSCTRASPRYPLRRAPGGSASSIRWCGPRSTVSEAPLAAAPPIGRWRM